MRETDHVLSAGNARSDAIEKLPAAFVYGPETSLAFMRVTLLRLCGNIEAMVKQLNFVRRQNPGYSLSIAN